MSLEGEGSFKVDNLSFQNEVKNYLDDSPLTSNIRNENPNLQPMGPDFDIPVTKSGPRRRKPSYPVPIELPPSDLSISTVPDQDFWKFHLSRFGHDMYLTTNPTPRHLHCRSFPGYYIVIQDNALDYTLSFEDIETGMTYFKIRKRNTNEGEFFRYKMRRVRLLENGKIMQNDSDSKVYENYLRREVIPPNLFSAPPDFPTASYLTQDFNEMSWSIGSLPRVRGSRISSGESRYIGKRNIYFHNSFAFPVLHPMFDIPPVKAVFRPSEASATKRIMRSINKLLKIDKSGNNIKSADLKSSMFSEVKNYFKAGDGLYGVQNPADDDPDKYYKHGWLTVYDDESLLVPGMFDLLVGLSVTVVYERLIRQ